MIVIVNIGKDQKYNELESFGTVIYVNEIQTEEQLVNACVNAEVIVLNAISMSAETLQKLPKLKAITICGSGFDNVNIVKARELGIFVCNAPNYGAPAVAQHTIALILELCNNVGKYNSYVKNHGWTVSLKAAQKSSIFELNGKTVGIFGFGSIGQLVARILTVFGVKVLVHNRTKYEISDLDVEYVSLKELFQRSDIITLHARLDDSIEGIIGHKYLSSMKEKSFLINTARGGLINETDLISGLKTGKPFAAAIDVTASEPLSDDSELRELPNCIITPHIAWNSSESLNRLHDISRKNIRCFYQGKLQNVVT